jgi:hypothetical protein
MILATQKNYTFLRSQLKIWNLDLPKAVLLTVCKSAEFKAESHRRQYNLSDYRAQLL